MTLSVYYMCKRDSPVIAIRVWHVNPITYNGVPYKNILEFGPRFRALSLLTMKYLATWSCWYSYTQPNRWRGFHTQSVSVSYWLPERLLSAVLWPPGHPSALLYTKLTGITLQYNNQKKNPPFTKHRARVFFKIPALLQLFRTQHLKSFTPPAATTAFSTQPEG